MTDFQNKQTRTKQIFWLIASVFFILLMRIAYLSLFQGHESLKRLAHSQYQKEIRLSPYRGTIYDSRKSPLAISVKSPSLFVNPKTFHPNHPQLIQLEKILKISRKKIKDIQNKKTYFAWLARKVTPQQVEKIKSLDIQGVQILWEPARFYPLGGSAASVVGYVGMDDVGLVGLEHSFDHLLKGSDIFMTPFRDARGNVFLMNAKNATPSQSGYSISLTIDRVIQDIAFEELSKAVKSADAEQGMAVVADPHTGRILASVSFPTFNPNLSKLESLRGTSHLPGSFLFEPGSVVKPIIFSELLDKKKITPNQEFECGQNGRLEIAPRQTIHDDHPRNKLTAEEIVVFSSNICTYKLAQFLQKKGLENAFLKFGLGGTYPLEGPPYRSGSLSDSDRWSELRFANIAFGQGFLANSYEITQAFFPFANGGFIVKPRIIDQILDENGQVVSKSFEELPKRVISKSAADITKQVLHKVISGGTGKQAESKFYSTAGKTGTAEKYDLEQHSYSPTKRVASFMGMAPVQNPHIVVYVVIDEPKIPPYYGGKWAAPAFREIIDRSLRYLNVAPDKGAELAQK